MVSNNESYDLIVVGKSGYLDGYDHGGRRLWSQSLSGRGTGRLALGFPGNVAQADAYIAKARCVTASRTWVQTVCAAARNGANV